MRVRYPTSTRVSGIGAALDEFLVSPSSDGGHSNEEVVVHVIGGVHQADRTAFDAVRVKYGRPVSTFEEAFKKCFRRRFGILDWDGFDIATLRACGHPDPSEPHEEPLRHLQLPERVEAALERRAIQGEADRAYHPMEDWAPVFEPVAHPPLELRRRPGPRKRSRKRKSNIGECTLARRSLIKARLRVKDSCPIPPRKR